MKKGFGFRLRFQVPPGSEFVGVHPTRRIRLPGVSERVYLKKLKKPRRHRSFSRAGYAFVGHGFISMNAAAECGQRLGTALGIASANLGFGLDVGKDKASSSLGAEVRKELEAKFRVQIRADIHGLDVYSENVPVTRFAAEGYGTSRRLISEYEEPLLAAFRRHRSLTKRQHVALRLYNLSYFETVSTWRCLSLITVLEVLAERERKDLQILRFLDDVLVDSKLAMIVQDKRAELIEGIKGLKVESIGSACKRLVASHATTEGVSFFVSSYRARGKLLHNGDEQAIQSLDLARLDALVRQVLLAELS